MCGRFTSRAPADEVAAAFGAAVATGDLGARFNVAPTDDVYAVAETADGQRRLGCMRWGLVPPWADGPHVGSRMINARAETVADRPAFRGALARRRCIVPADGFYEWQRRPDRAGKQPWHIRRPDGGLLAFAGLWEVWRPRTGSAERRGDVAGDRLVTCTIITTAANPTVAPLHDRMPAILPPEAWDEWLDPRHDDVEALSEWLAPAADDLLELVAVSPLVNKATNDGPELLAPAAPSELFPPV